MNLLGPSKMGDNKGGLLNGPATPAKRCTDHLVDRAEGTVELERYPTEVVELGLMAGVPVVYNKFPSNVSRTAPMIAGHGSLVYQNRR